MGLIEKSSSRDRSEAAVALFYDERVRATFYQSLLFGLVSWGLWYLLTNTSENLHARGMSTGFGFLNSSAGFDTDFKLITYRPDHTYGRIYLVGILNTLFVSWGAILGATAIGLVMGVARLSTNWLVAKLASAYVEIIRNVPLLIQIVCWYLGIFALLPRPKQSVDFFDFGIAYLNNRGLYLPNPLPQDLFWLTGLAMAVAIGAVFWLRAWARHRLARTGEPFPVILLSLATLIGLPALAFLATGQPLDWEIAALEGFNYQGGLRLPPSFLALVIALTIYHSAGMTETVRAGIQSVDKGQREAAYSVGLSHARTLQLVVIPQALRAIVPPTISLWMTIVKNSSLGVAIGYPEIVSLYMQTSLNQSGYAIEIVAMTMLFYMTVSLLISACMNVYNKRVQLTER